MRLRTCPSLAGWLMVIFCAILWGLVPAIGRIVAEDAAVKPAAPASKPLSRSRAASLIPKTAKPEEAAAEEEAELEPALPKRPGKSEKAKLPQEKPTHEQLTKITIGGGASPCSLNTFCLTTDGKLIAAVGCSQSSSRGTKTDKAAEPKAIGQLRWFDGDGKALDVWSLDVAPTAVNVAPNGSIFTAGGGKLLKLDATGKVLTTADTPNKKDLEDNADAIRKEVAEIFTSPKARYEQNLVTMKARVEELQDKEKKAQDDGKELSRTDKVRLTSARRTVESLEKLLAGLSDEDSSNASNAAQIMSFADSKKRVSGIAVTETDVFVACPAALGFGYDIWRLNHNLEEPVKIVQKLRGCCGQMDIQARGTDLCVAENSMHRVCRYDRDGKLVKAWGEREGISQRGFEGCCNPMNLRIASNGEVYTSESSIGRIRRFSPDGEYLGLVGQAKLISGCKHVAIGVTTDTKRVYLLDVTKGEIVVLQQQEGDKTAAK